MKSHSNEFDPSQKGGLVLTRADGESIIIDSKIRVKMLGKNKFGEMRVEIYAPEEVEIDRLENWRK